MTYNFIHRLFSFIILLCTTFSVYAQTDSSIADVDVTDTVAIQSYNVRLAEIERQRLADSVTRIQLQARLNSLQTTDNLEKEKLLVQLRQLNEKETSRIARKKMEIDSMRSITKAYPVTAFFNDTLFLIYNKLGSFSAKERAEVISTRIKNLAGDFSFNPDSLKLVTAEATIDIMFDDRIIMSVSENDALWNNATKNDLANAYMLRIGNAVQRYRNETSLMTIAKEAAMALLVIFVIGLLIYYIGKLFRWTAAKIEAQKGAKLRGVRIRDYTMLDAEGQVKTLLNINAFLKWLVILLAVYIALPVLFGIFPQTENYADVLFSYILTPVKKIALSFWHYLPNLITIIVIILVFRFVFRFIAFLKAEIEAGNLKLPGFYTDWANPTYQIVRVMVLAFMIVVIFPYLPGSDSPIFKGVSVFLGFLFTFGSAGSLSNIIAGFILTYMRLFKIGDRVKIGEVLGDVIEKSLLVTRVRTTKNEIISIPNSTVMSSHAINYSSDAPEKGLIVHTTITLGYDVPWRKVHQALTDAALRTDMILKEPAPFVLQTSLDDFYVSYQVNGYTRDPNKQATIYSDLHQHIQDVCNEQGIEILSPHYRAARDGSRTTIPDTYLPKDYQPPGFNFNIWREHKK